MPFEIILHISENSQRGQIIQQMADTQHLAREQVVERMIDAGIQAQGQSLPFQTVKGKTPAERLIGLFSSSEDAALMDEVTAIDYEGRRTETTRDIGL